MSRSTTWCCTTMIGRLAALFLLSAESVIPTRDAPALVSLTVVKLGDNFTLKCPVSSDKTNREYHWYKQSLGHIPHTVASRIFLKMEINQFDKRFMVKKVDNEYLLTIMNVSKEDEATYLCQNGTTLTKTFVRGTFLAVNDESQQEHVYLKQDPEKVSGRPGTLVTLHCSFISKNKRVQCPGEDSVFWFRAGSGLSHPSLIYIHKNRSNEEKSCIYTLSKTIQNSSDDGIYHCAVLTCGKILFGKGTYVNTGNSLDPTVPVLGLLLACCVTVIVALIFFVIRNQRKVCKHCEGAMRAAHHRENDRSSLEASNNVDAVNYVALDFPARKVKRVKEKQNAPTECLYSAIEVK